MSENPYQAFPDEDRLAPFAGRQAELASVDHYLKNPGATHALIFLGQRWKGKTALLRRFDSVFQEPFVGAYLPLANIDLKSEVDLFRALVEAISYYLVRRDYTASRIPLPEDEPDDWRAWMTHNWLPEIIHIIRPHRKLVLLLDDAHHWLAAEEDSFVYFRSLLRDHPQLKLVMTMNAVAEDRLGLMAPLFNPAHVQRLTNLTLDECRWLLQAPPASRYTITEDSVQAVYRATGGHPQLTQRFAHHIYNYRDAHPDQHIITPQVIKALTTVVYTHSERELANMWTESMDNEQLILTAVSDLHYDDPLARISADQVSSWLVQGDYPMDTTTVHAALRSLEYRELLTHRGDNIELAGHLLQMWLLDNARRSTMRSFRMSRRAESADTSSPPRRHRPILIAGVVAVIILLVLIINLSNTPQLTENSNNLLPTVTLAGQ